MHVQDVHSAVIVTRGQLPCSHAHARVHRLNTQTPAQPLPTHDHSRTQRAETAPVHAEHGVGVCICGLQFVVYGLARVLERQNRYMESIALASVLVMNQPAAAEGVLVACQLAASSLARRRRLFRPNTGGTSAMVPQRRIVQTCVRSCSRACLPACQRVCCVYAPGRVGGCTSVPASSPRTCHRTRPCGQNRVRWV